MKTIQKLYIIIVVVIAVSSIISSVFLYQDNTRLKQDIEKREILLTSALNQDSTWRVKQDSIIKTVEKTFFFYAGDKKMNGDEFIRYVNDLFAKYENAMDSLQYYKQYYIMTKDVFKPNFRAEIDSSANMIKYSIKHDASNIVDNEEIKQFATDSKILKSVLERYNIVVKDLGNGYVTFESPQIDSALILLPYHRKELEYIPEKKCWVITRTEISTSKSKK